MFKRGKNIDEFFSNEVINYFAEHSTITFGQEEQDVPGNYISRKLESTEDKSTWSEENFLDKKGVYAINSHAGGGKSVLFRSLFNKKKETEKQSEDDYCDKCWVILFDLNMFEEKHQKIKESKISDLDKLAEMFSFNIAEKRLFPVFEGQFTLILDSFDEIDSDQQKEVIKWVKGVREHFYQIWIGSREQKENKWVNFESIKQIKIVGFKTEEQLDYIKSISKKEGVKELVDKFKECCNESFLEIPLNCRFLAEYFESRGMEGIEDISDWISHDGVNLAKFYESYLNSKVRIYVGTTCIPGIVKNIEKSAEIMYSQLAAKHFCNTIPDLLQLSNDLDIILKADEPKALLAIGLTDTSGQFFHRSMDEYFFSIFFLRQLLNLNEGIFLDRRYNKFFVERIRSQYKYGRVRQFANEQLHLVGNKLMYRKWKVDDDSLLALNLAQAKELIGDAIADNLRPLAALVFLCIGRTNMTRKIKICCEASNLKFVLHEIMEYDSSTGILDDKIETMLNVIFSVVELFESRFIESTACCCYGKMFRRINTNNPFYVAAEKGAHRGLKLLLEKALDYTKKGNYNFFITKHKYNKTDNVSLLYLAIDFEKVEFVKKLMTFSNEKKVKLEILMVKCEIKDSSSYPLSFAIEKKKNELVKAILDGLAPYVHLGMTQPVDNFDKLIKVLGFDSKEDSPLNLAVRSKNVETMYHILEFLKSFLDTSGDDKTNANEEIRKKIDTIIEESEMEACLRLHGPDANKEGGADDQPARKMARFNILDLPKQDFLGLFSKQYQ